MTTGFFGKIPATGDFVGRNLSPKFLRAWDSWITRHLVPLMTSGEWSEEAALFFILGPEFMGPMAGVAMPSRDRAGRRFPLTVAAPVEAADVMLAARGDWWLAAVQAIRTAQQGGIGVDELAAFLSSLAAPGVSDGSRHPVSRMCAWTRIDEIMDVDPMNPEPALRQILSASTLPQSDSEPAGLYEPAGGGGEDGSAVPVPIRGGG